MPNPQFIESHPLTLVEVKTTLEALKKRDIELNPLSTKLQEYVGAFVTLPPQKKEELQRKLVGLSLTRLKEEHITKITDFLPTTVNELKIVLQAYPLSLAKKDQESIVATVKEVLT